MKVEIAVSIRGTVDTAMLSHIFESAKSATPVDGILSFEVDGSNDEPSMSDPDWYDTHCPTCDAPEPWHTAECAVPFRPADVEIGGQR